MYRFMAAGVGVLFAVESALAQNPPTTRAETGDVRTFAVTPAAVTPGAGPALAVPLTEQTDTNAAPSWREAFEPLKGAGFMPDVEAALALPTDTAFRAALPGLDATLPNAAWEASRANTCDWGLDLSKGLNLTLPHLGDAHHSALVLRAKIRLAVASGDLRSAVRAATTLGALADDLQAEPPILVAQLVAVGVKVQWLNAAHTLHELDGLPNLSADFSDSTRPWGKWRAAFEIEAKLPEYLFPELRALTRGERLTRPQWAKVLADAARFRSVNSPPPDTNADRGLEYYKEFRDAVAELIDASAGGYPEALPRMKEARAAVTARLRRPGASGPFVALIPNFEWAVRTNARLDRAIAAFAIVEALRAHAAASSGIFPAALTDLKGPPAVNNPMTSGPFKYTLQPDGSAILADETSDPSYPLRYTIRLRK